MLVLAVPVSTRAQEAPRRVVSMNLCADQIAMSLAAPGQLLSVSALAQDPRSSAMADKAMAWPANNAGAEEIWLMQPDLVIAGAYTSRATVDMLRRLGIEVLEVYPAYSLADIRDRMAQIGTALGRDGEAAAQIDRFDARLATLQADVARRPRAAIYYANGYTTGNNTLAGEILITAGFENIAGDMRGGGLPLERLIMEMPEVLISGTPYDRPSRSEAILQHPALDRLRADGEGLQVPDPDWICGTPHVLQTISGLASFRQTVE